MAFPQPYPNDMKPSYPSMYPVNPGMPQQSYPSPPYYNAPPPPQMPHVQPVVVVQPFGRSVGHSAQATQCPACSQQIVTSVRYESGGGTWLFAFLIFIFGGIFGCCLIPFCVNSCQDAVHTCPACGAPIGRRNIL